MALRNVPRSIALYFCEVMMPSCTVTLFVFVFYNDLFLKNYVQVDTLVCR